MNIERFSRQGLKEGQRRYGAKNAAQEPIRDYCDKCGKIKMVKLFSGKKIGFLCSDCARSEGLRPFENGGKPYAQPVCKRGQGMKENKDA